MLPDGELVTIAGRWVARESGLRLEVIDVQSLRPHYALTIWGARLSLGTAGLAAGAMLNDGRAFIAAAPQLNGLSGLAISIVVVGLNLLGDGLRDAFDPHVRL